MLNTAADVGAVACEIRVAASAKPLGVELDAVSLRRWRVVARLRGVDIQGQSVAFAA
jgi:hypothetical protein